MPAVPFIPGSGARAAGASHGFRNPGRRSVGHEGSRLFGLAGLVDFRSQPRELEYFEGAYRLTQAEQFWPRGTVFVAVVDPGVGTERLSVVLKTRTGHYFVGPDNGLLSLVAERDGIEGLRQIDERVNRRPGSDESHTFHGRDVFAFTGARLAAGVIDFEQVGRAAWH